MNPNRQRLIAEAEKAIEIVYSQYAQFSTYENLKADIETLNGFMKELQLTAKRLPNNQEEVDESLRARMLISVMYAAVYKGEL